MLRGTIAPHTPQFDAFKLTSPGGTEEYVYDDYVPPADVQHEQRSASMRAETRRLRELARDLEEGVSDDE